MLCTGSVILPFCFHVHFRRVHIGWMATIWIYPPEILPLKLREKGPALAAAAETLWFMSIIRFERLIQTYVFTGRPDHATWDTRRTLSLQSSTLSMHVSCGLFTPRQQDRRSSRWMTCFGAMTSLLVHASLGCNRRSSTRQQSL